MANTDALFQAGTALFQATTALFPSGTALLQATSALFPSGAALFQATSALFPSGAALFQAGTVFSVRSRFRQTVTLLTGKGSICRKSNPLTL